MNYIVFDLEWNQCPYGKGQENERIPFEIIEIVPLYNGSPQVLHNLLVHRPLTVKFPVHRHLLCVIVLVH